MKIIFLLIFIVLINGCSNNKIAYWCGDHECIDNEEKSEYFQKNMVIEVKNIKKKNKKTEFEKILEQSQEKNKKILLQNKNLSKLEKKEDKFRIKEDKKIAKELRKEEKKRIKNERKLAKIKKKETIKKIKNSKKKVTKKKILKIEKPSKRVVDNSKTFSEIVKRIQEANYNKPFRNINDIPD